MKIKITFIISILIVLFLPVFFFNVKTDVSNTEKRKLAPKPHLLKDDHFNERLFAECDNYLQDHMGFREALIYFDSKNPLKIEVSTNFDRAIKGKDGWFFFTDPAYGNNLLDFYKRNLLNDEQLNDFLHSIKEITSWCDQNNIKYIFLIGPNKHSVYPEFYPFDRPKGMTRTDQLTEIFHKLDVPYIYPRDYLISKKPDYNFPLYYQTDTHWNLEGAYLTYNLLKDEIISLFPQTKFPNPPYKRVISESTNFGDLLPILNLKESKCTIVDYNLEGKQKTDYYTYLKNEDQGGIHTKGNNPDLPRAIVFRDSFFVALEPFVSPLFSEVDYIWKPFNDSYKNYILEYKPDIIIFESVERDSLRLSPAFQF